jgi:hypothetical protein
MIGPIQHSVRFQGSHRQESSLTPWLKLKSAIGSTLPMIGVGLHSPFAGAGDIGVEPNRQIELFYSQQHTALTSGALLPQANNAVPALHKNR